MLNPNKRTGGANRQRAGLQPIGAAHGLDEVPAQERMQGYKPRQGTTQISYKNFTVKEEMQKQSKNRPQSSSQYNSSVMSQKSQSRPASAGHMRKKADAVQKPVKLHQTTSTSAEITQIAEQKHRRFMQLQARGEIDDDDSLLADSLAEPDREEKQEILEQQKLRRRREATLAKHMKEQEAAKQLANMDQLQQTLKNQAMHMKVKAKSEARKAQRKEKDRKKSVEKAMANFKEGRKSVSSKPKDSDLQAWIAKEINKEMGDDQGAAFSVSSDEDDEAFEIPKKGRNKKVNNYSVRNDSANSRDPTKNNSDVVMLDLFASTENEKMVLAKHKLPGNHLLSDKEQSKLGGRKDRYGTKVMAAGVNGSEFDKIVQIERTKMQPESGRPPKKALSQKQKTDIKAGANSQLADLKIRTGGGKPQEVEADHSEDSLDKVPTREPSTTKRKILNDQPKKKTNADHRELPGTSKIHLEAERQKKQEEERKAKAAVCIQRRIRGHWGRRDVARRRYILKDRIEAEYGDFERDFKFNEEFNMQRWMKEKRRVALLNAGGSASYMDEIDEVIGESSSIHNLKTSAQALKLQNYFQKSTAASETDPLSLISIFAARHGQLPDQSTRTIGDLVDTRRRKRHDSSGKKRRSSGKRGGGKAAKRHSSGKISSGEIEEEISYSSAFDSDRSRSGSKSGSIKEDIVGGSVDLSRASTSWVQNQKKKLTLVKDKGSNRLAMKKHGTAPAVTSPISSGIVDEAIEIDSEIKSAKSSDIAEESHLQGSSFGNEEDSRQRPDIISEESAIRSDWDKGNFEEKQQQQSLQVRKYISFGGKEVSAKEHPDIKKLDVLSSMEQKQVEGDLRRREILSDVMKEMAEYEKATVSTVVVDRMEKIVTASLAQKDQLLMGQRLAELERENRHQEEITRIREEQIAQMTQLMLMLAGSGGFGFGGGVLPGTQDVDPEQKRAADKQRQSIMDSIQALISKPIVVQNETLQVNIDANQRRMGMGKMNTGEEKPMSPKNQRIDVNMKGKPKLTYLQEHDLAQKRAKDLARGGINEEIEEDIMESASNILSQSKRTGGSIKTSMDFIVDEVGNSIQESIRESIQDSQSLQNLKMHPKNLSVGSAPVKSKGEKFQVFKDRRFRELKSQSSTEMSHFLEQMNEAIDHEREMKEQELRQDLRFKKIDTKTFDRKKREVERWAIDQREEVSLKRETMIQIRDAATYQKKSRFGGKQTATAYNDDESDDDEYGGASDESDITREARIQRHLMRKGFGQPHEMRNNQRIERKLELAQKLMEDKNKQIKDGLKEKMKSLQSEKAEVLMKNAVELDVEKEIEKLFSQVKDKIGNDESLGPEESSVSLPGRKVQFQVAPQSFALGSAPPSKAGKFSSQPAPDDDSICESIAVDSQYSKSMGQESLTQGLESGSGPSGANSATMPRNRFGGNAQMTDSRSKVDSESGLASEIESDYTEDFADSASHQSKSAVGKSAQLLQKKADAMVEESAAYSEDFEESLAKSAADQKALLASGQKKDEENMNTVIEESIDESIPTGGRSPDESGSGHRASHSGQGIEVSGDSEIPSEDMEIQQSARSIEWQIQIDNSVGDRTPSPPGRRKGSPKGQEETISEQLREEDSSFYGSEERKGKSKSPEEESDLNDRYADEEGLEDESEEQTDPTGTEKGHSSGMAEMESVPDKIDSVSQSLDERLVEQITQELFEGMMQQYKVDASLDLTTAPKPIDEDEFAQKWPYTLDKVEEPVKKVIAKNSSSELEKRGAHVPQKEKTETQKADEDFKVKHEAMSRQQAEVLKNESDFLDFMIERVKLDTLIDVLSEPISHDPLKMLARIQAYSDEDLSLSNANDLSNPADQQVLPQVFFNKVEREFAVISRMKTNGNLTRSGAENSEDLSAPQQEAESIANTHHYALYETLNEALDMERPYQYKGEPMPWSKNTRLARQRITTEQAKSILEKAKKKVQEWGCTSAGTKVAPLPPPPPLSHDDFGSEVTPPPLQEGELERRDLLRQERLGEVLTKDINESEPLWLDYEIEDTQTRFDLADMILTTLAGEATEILTELMNRRF